MIEIRTPAKVNLVLDVLSRRPDGFHEIRSLMIKVGLYDRLTFAPDEGGAISLSCSAPEIPCDGRNLVYQAAECIGREMGRIPGCRIHLEKAIPVGGGMGGGSGNAAGALLALNRLWDAGIGAARLAELGATLGSDVPFFFAAEGAIVSGRGDCVRPVRPAFSGWVVLVFGGMHVSTAQVYARCTPRSPESFRDSLDDLVAVRRADVLRASLRNGLEDAVFAVAPRVRSFYEQVARAAGRALRVSGAGSVLFDLFDAEHEAEALAERLRSAGITQEIRVVRAPVSQ